MPAHTCSACNSLLLRDGPCPHCGTTPPILLTALLVGLAGCDSGETFKAVPAYGIAETGFVDADGDGYAASEDCDDDNDQVYPGAPETLQDGVDSNCDGFDDT